MTKNYLNSRDAFYKSALKTKEVMLSDGVIVRIRELNGGQLLKHNEIVRTLKENTTDKIAELLIMFSVIDEEGNSIFTDENPPQMNKISFRNIQTLVTEIMELNGMTQSQTVVSNLKNAKKKISN